MASKQALRTSIKKSLDSLTSANVHAQSERTAQALRNHRFYKASKTIAFYMHMDHGELHTLSMIANAFSDGKRVFLPHIVKYAPGEEHPWYPTQKTHLQMLEMPSFASVEKLTPHGKYNLKEPLAGLNSLSEDGAGLDLLVLPGVGFSKSCRRLGHGAGYYDSFVSEHEHKKGRVPRLIGVGLEEQLVEPGTNIPQAEHDRIMDAVIIGGQAFEQ